MNREIPLVFMQVVPEGAPEAARLDVTETLLSFEYEDVEDGADKLKFTVRNDLLAEFDNPLWKKGNLLFVQWGYPGAMAPPRKAVIEKIAGFDTLSVEAHALSMVMNTVSRRRQWEQRTRSEIAAELASEWGYGPEMQVIETTTQRFETITQAAMPDARFLMALARKQGFVFFVDFDGFHFHSRQTRQRTHRTYTYFTDPGHGEVVSVSVENDVTAKKTVVIAIGEDPGTKEPVNSVNLDGLRAPEGSHLSDQDYRDVVISTTSGPISTVPEFVWSAARERGMELMGQAASIASRAMDDDITGPTRELMLRAADHRRDAGRSLLDMEHATYFTPRVENVGGTPVIPEPPRSDVTPSQFAAVQELQRIVAAQAGDVAATLQPYPAISRLGSEEVVQTTATTPEEAATQARATQTRTQLTAVKLRVEIIGDPTLLAKTMVEMRGISRRLSGPYYCKSVRHKVLPAPYLCTMELRSDGTRGYGDPQFPEVTRQNARDADQEQAVKVFGPDWEFGSPLPRTARTTPEGEEYETFDATGSDRNTGVSPGPAYEAWKTGRSDSTWAGRRGWGEAGRDMET